MPLLVSISVHLHGLGISRAVGTIENSPAIHCHPHGLGISMDFMSRRTTENGPVIHCQVQNWNIRFQPGQPGNYGGELDMHQITLAIPDNLYNHVHRLARAASKPVEKVLMTAIHTSLPSLDGLPADMVRYLTDLENRDTDELREVLSETVPREQQKMMESLLHRNQLGIISQAENRQLTSLQQAAGRVMLRKARADVLLRFRGKRLPTLAELRRQSFGE